MKGDHWELKYLPVGMIVKPVGIDAGDVGGVSEGLPKGTSFVGTNYETVELKIPAAVRKRYDIPPQAPSKSKSSSRVLRIPANLVLVPYVPRLSLFPRIFQTPFLAWTC